MKGACAIGLFYILDDLSYLWCVFGWFAVSAGLFTAYQVEQPNLGLVSHFKTRQFGEIRHITHRFCISGSHPYHILPYPYDQCTVRFVR